MNKRLLRLKVMASTILLATSTYFLTGCSKEGKITDFTDAEIAEEYQKRNLEEKLELEKNNVLTEDDILYLPGQHYVVTRDEKVAYHEGYELAASYCYGDLNCAVVCFVYVNNEPVKTQDPYRFGQVINIDSIEHQKAKK